MRALILFFSILFVCEHLLRLILIPVGEYLDTACICSSSNVDWKGPNVSAP